VLFFFHYLISLWTSFTPFKLTRPDTLYKFVGFRNYERLIGNYDFWVAFGRTVLFLTIALNLELVFGLGIALLINKITYAQKTLRTLMMFPMMFSPILSWLSMEIYF
jgi:multiple sugar transport system permease protein